jgi:hypothetical protein
VSVANGSHARWLATCLLALVTPEAEAQAQGRSVLVEVPYIAVTTCANEVLRVGPYLVLCNDFSYPYHYGGAILVAERWARQGETLAVYKLCLKGSQPCIHVELLRRQ